VVVLLLVGEETETETETEKEESKKKEEMKREKIRTKRTKHKKLNTRNWGKFYAKWAGIWAYPKKFLQFAANSGEFSAFPRNTLSEHFLNSSEYVPIDN